MLSQSIDLICRCIKSTNLLQRPIESKRSHRLTLMAQASGRVDGSTYAVGQNDFGKKTTVFVAIKPSL